MARHPAGDPGPVQEAIRVAIHSAGRADPDGWRHAVDSACAADEQAADRFARVELAERVRAQGIETGMVAPIANGARTLASAAEDGPFAVPEHLLELAIRRALDEPGCVAHVEVRELVYASTQCAGMLDIHDALLPAGWGWLIQLPLPVD